MKVSRDYRSLCSPNFLESTSWNRQFGKTENVAGESGMLETDYRFHGYFNAKIWGG